MRYRRSTLLLRKTGLGALAALLFALGTGAAQAQLPVFNSVDWLLDRGNLSFDAATSSGIPLRPGSNDFNNPTNRPGHAVRRFVFPRTFDLTNGTSISPTRVVDNANAADPLNFSDMNGNVVRTSPAYAMQMGLDPQQMAHSYLNNGIGAWILPAVPADGTAADYRSPGSGFSFTSDSSQTYSFDYAFTPAAHNDFTITDDTGQKRPASAAELAALPYVASNVYAGVQSALVNDTHSTATYSSGSYNILPGNYGVDIYSPGSGTRIGGIVHPNVTRALVRVSWFQTVDNNGNIVKANTEAPVTSRIFEVDLGQAGWIHLQGGGATQAIFPFDGNPQNQIAVTVYSITPDSLNDPAFPSFPLITADAVRFVARTSGSDGLVSPPLFPLPPPPTAQRISPLGRILGPAIGTNKLVKTAGGLPIADVQPLIFFAREEAVPDLTPRIPKDPTMPVSVTNPLIPDPTATVTAPVFYCIDSRNGNVVGNDGDGFLASSERVRWRYVGMADASNGDGTSAASPMIANVRCRDGMTRTIVYFLTTNTSGGFGHIYAFDAAGNSTAGPGVFGTTQNYWTYPSFRPLTGAELAGAQVPAEYHDPNYKGFAQGTFPAPAWGGDIADPFFHYDGEILPNPTNANEFLVRSDTRLPSFGGSQGSPVIIDDPSAPAGGQILVVGNLNGRVYAFDAGGRGDFDPLNVASTGTTQRIWTWPHFGADAYYAQNLVGTNRIVDDPSLGTILSSPAYDPNYIGVDLTKKPILIPAGDGHLYAINGPHDLLVSYNANTAKAVWQDRRNWVYPAPDNAGLGGALSTVSIFQPAGAAFPYVYFTCNGLAYAVQEVPPVIAPTAPTINTLKWVYPSTPNPPFPDPNNNAIGPLTPGFNGTAPVLLSQGMLNATPAFAGSPVVTNDYCYVVQGNSTVYGLNAFDGTLLATGETPTGSSTSASPMATLLIGLPGDTISTPATTNPQPAIVFADDRGAIFGLAARPDTGLQGPRGGFLMSPIWHHYEVQQTRIAAASLVNGLIIEGDEGGQLRAYGVGTGLNGLIETVGPGEPVEPPLGAGNLTIDVRALDVYTKVDFDNMMLTSPLTPAGKKTALRQPGGGAFGNSASPSPGNLSTNATTAPYATDWGDYVYVAAAGVYHAQPTDDPANPLRGTGPPNIRVVFTFTTPGGGTLTKEVIVPATTKALHALPGERWPDDLALTDAERDTLKIYGTDDAMGTKILQGRDQNVYPWIAKQAFFINPTTLADPNTGNGNVTKSGTLNFLPGTTSYRITAVATIMQPGEATVTSQTYSLGQTDFTGQTAQFQTPQTIRRIFGITNPLAVTTRGITNINDMTGTANRNVIGLFGSIDSPVAPANGGELVGNGNNQRIPTINSANSSYKSVFAPLPMVPDGATSTYSAVDGFGNRMDAFYVVDRSNLINTLGVPLQVRVLPRKINWHGWGPSDNPTATGSAVMNALPWEQLPSNGQDSLDYPGIAPTAFAIRKSTGEDAIGGRVTLMNQPSAIAITRQLVGTPFSLQLTVPRFQPANVNYGVHTFNGITFGSSYMDKSGVNRGDPTAGNAYDRHILGPLITNTGGQAVLGSGPVYPAGGYLSGFDVEVAMNASVNGGGQGSTGFSPLNGFNVASRRSNNSASNNAYREVEVGIAVPPGVRMRIAETTLDVGKLPHGTGYTPLKDITDARSFQVPFAPNMSSQFAAAPSYWDDPNLGGEFFRPFTLFSESNVNLVDVRVAKVLGQNFSQIDGRTLSQYTDITAGTENTAIAASLLIPSDQVSGQSISSLFAVPFKNVPGAIGVGNAGLVSSFDHISISSNPVSSKFAERALWPLTNPYVVQADIDVANQIYGAMLPTMDSVVNGIMGWKDNSQPQPTIGKPRVGDGQGRTASIPDQPYSGNSLFQRPRIGMAIPLGTPVGTYSAPVYAFEDNTPIQWQEWLSHYPTPVGVTQNFPVPHDGILNVTKAGSPSEAHTDPTLIFKVAVREAKMSRETTRGDLAMLDTFGSWTDPSSVGYTTPPGSDNFPAAYMAPGGGNNVFNRNLYMYWSTNRRVAPDGYISNINGLLRPFAPYTIAVSHVPAPYSGVNGTNIVLGDFDFAKPKGVALNGTPLSGWWAGPAFNQYDNSSVYGLFPASVSGSNPFLTGTANVDTMRLVHPAVAASLDYSGGYNSLNPNDPESYLFWQGQVDKATAANSGAFQTRDSRLSWIRLNGGANPGEPFGSIYAMPNDPTLTKLAPRPLLVKLPAANGAPAQKFLYVFWHAGNQSNASIYYNAMVTTALNTPFDNTQWLTDGASPAKPIGDMKLPTPGALVWQSDPAPIYRRIPVPNSIGQYVDVVDVVFTGVLKGRQTVETLLTRYQINRTAPVNPGDPPIGSLTLLPLQGSLTTLLPKRAYLGKVTGEVLTRVGNTNTFQARDAAWALGTGPQGTLDPTDTESQISIYQTTGNLNSAPILLNRQTAGPNQGLPQLGKYDQASGLLFYDSSLGGQIVVDIRAGTVRFPQVAPGLADRIQVNYVPYVMRLNTSRDDSNVDRSNAAPYGNLAGAPGFVPTASITSSGNNTSPVVIFDRGFNTRSLFVAPQVVFPQGPATPTLDRMWVLYRKNDPSGVAKSTIYYKAMRLMVKLPYPVLLDKPDPMTGAQQMTPVAVAGNQGPYEVDYVRGRIYFTEVDEHRKITVQYQAYNPATGAVANSGTLTYHAEWGDEISSSIQQGDQTTPEVALPTDSAVSEGQVAAFKDPFLDKLWIFWSSTRAGSTDLYFETIAPQFYPAVSNQR